MLSEHSLDIRLVDAVERNQIAQVKQLLHLGASAQSKKHQIGSWCVLHTASFNGSEEIVCELLKSGAPSRSRIHSNGSTSPLEGSTSLFLASLNEFLSKQTSSGVVKYT